MKLTECEVGLRVKYVVPDSYGDIEKQPLWGGKYGKIPGQIVKITPADNFPIHVKFANGRKSMLKPISLEVLHPDDLGWLDKLKIFKVKTACKWRTEHKKRFEACIRYLKPYRKYIGLVVLLLVVDYFLFNGKYLSNVKNNADKLVDRLLRRSEAALEITNESEDS